MTRLTSLENDIREASLALDYFLDNRITECMDLLLAKSEYSLYHSLGLSAARFMYSVLTFERVSRGSPCRWQSVCHVGWQLVSILCRDGWVTRSRRLVLPFVMCFDRRFCSAFTSTLTPCHTHLPLQAMSHPCLSLIVFVLAPPFPSERHGSGARHDPKSNRHLEPEKEAHQPKRVLLGI